MKTVTPHLRRPLRPHHRRSCPPRRHRSDRAVERDFATYGDEAKFGGGKVIRDGMGQSPFATASDGAPDLVITSALIIDSTGIYKADVGVRDGRISAIGKAGKSGIMDGVTPGLEIGAATEILPAKGTSSPRAASTPTCISFRRIRFPTRFTPG